MRYLLYITIAAYILTAGCDGEQNMVKPVLATLVEDTSPVEDTSVPTVSIPETEIHTFTSRNGTQFEKVLFTSAEAAIASADFMTFLEEVKKFRKTCGETTPELVYADFDFTTERAGLEFYLLATELEGIRKPHLLYPGYDPLNDPEQSLVLSTELSENWWIATLHATCDK